MKLYDENEAIDFIISQLGDGATISKDALLEVIDALYDYYEENDELDFDFDDDDICDEDADIDAIVESIAPKVDLPDDIIRRIVIAEQNYQDTLL